jgi:predicted sulfurtransferase
MKPEKQRIAIAEATGWKCSEYSHELGQLVAQFVPDYLNDLNAMHQAMAHLEPEQVNQFAAELSGIVLENREKYWWDLTSNEVGHVANATAAQRAEAFLKTIGKWEEEG